MIKASARRATLLAVLIGSALFSGIFWVIPPAPAAEQSATRQTAGPEVNAVRVEVSSANIRTQPSLEADVSGRLTRGSRVRVHAIQGDWFFVESPDGQKGWMHRRLFTPSAAAAKPAEAPEPPEPSAPKTAGSSTKAPPAPPAATAGPGDSEFRKQPVVIQSNEAKRITLNFVDVDVRELLSALAINQEINIVMAQDVKGTVSVHLHQVSLEAALEAVALAGGFGYRRQNDLYYVYKPAGGRDPQAELLEMRTFRLRYMDPEKFEDVIQAIPDMRMIQFHEASRTIVVEDTPENIRRVEMLLRHWDAKPRQVMIEAKILEINLTDDMSLGVNWEKLFGDIRLGTGGFSTAVPADALAGGGASPIPSTGAGLFANFISAAGTGHQFTMAVDALRAKTRVNILSTPKLLAIHGKSATVQVGGQQGYKVTTSNLGVLTESIQFIDTGTILNITPYIDEEDSILLNVEPTINSAELEEGIPVVKSTTVSTWLLAKDGETVFIGGLIQDIQARQRNEIPCLGGLPLLRPVFGRSVEGIGKTELVVMITPTIIQAGRNADSQREKARIETIEKGFRKALDPFNPLD